jgi:hypothetical protein
MALDVVSEQSGAIESLRAALIHESSKNQEGSRSRSSSGSHCAFKQENQRLQQKLVVALARNANLELLVSRFTVGITELCHLLTNLKDKGFDELLHLTTSPELPLNIAPNVDYVFDQLTVTLRNFFIKDGCCN